MHAACHFRKREGHSFGKKRGTDSIIWHMSNISPSTWTKTYIKARGAMTMAKMGVVAMITIMVERETKKVPRNMSTVAGRASSMT